MTAENTRMSPPETYVFGPDRSRRGYRLNRLCMSLTEPACRAAFLADEEEYMSRFGLSDEERRWVHERDWLSMTRNGGNIYVLVKLAGTVGQNLLDIGAQMRGETLAEFLSTRPAREHLIKGH